MKRGPKTDLDRMKERIAIEIILARRIGKRYDILKSQAEVQQYFKMVEKNTESLDRFRKAPNPH